MKQLIKVGSTDVTLDVFIQDSSSTIGAGLTGLVFNSASLVCYYRRGALGSATALTLATQTVGGAHSDGGFVEVSAANMPGMYRLDLSDAIVATGVPYVSIMLKGAANMAPVTIELQLTAFDPGGALNEFADALLKRDWTGLTGEAARSVLNAMRFVRNKWSLSGTTLTVTKEDDTTSAWTATVTTNAAAEPITASDPA